MDWGSSNLPEAWRKFQNHVELVFKGPLQEKDEKTKCMYLLLWVGEKGRDIQNTWTGLEEGDLDKLKTYYDRYKAHVLPKLNPIFARYKFNKEIQGDNSIEEYLTRLRLLAKDCSFHDEEEMIRDRLVFGVTSPKVREKLISQGEKLTLDKAISICQTCAYTKEQMRLMDGTNTTTTETVHVVKSHKHSQKQHSTSSRPQHQNKRSTGPAQYGSVQKDKPVKTCGNCGYALHRPTETCPAKGKQCSSCKKWNHFAKMCRSKKTRTHNVSEVKTSEGQPGPGSDSDSDDFYVDSIDSNVHVDNQAFTTLEVGPTPVKIKFKLDTGSQVNILPYNTYRKLGPNIPLSKSSKNLSAYGGDTLNTVGCCKLVGKYRNTTIDQVEFFVVKTNSPPILGLRSCLDFQLIKLVYSVNTDTPLETREPMTRETVLRDFKETFHGVGLFPGECKIHVDPSATPVVHPPRRVPFALRERLKAELDRMENLEVIAKVSEPTDWVNSLVVVSKPHNNKLRVCLDPQDLNKAIQRPHYPMRTLEDILPKLTDAKFFTKLDARSGYWAIKLEKESSFLTTFNTPFGRYRFLRLPFGLKSSQDEFQRKMDECFEGLEGVCVIVDDILVYGQTRQDHDRHLRDVLIRARDRGIKLNEDKLEVGVPEVQYFGHSLTADGVKPDPSKVAAIHEMEPPKNRAELETVLGMVTYLAKFAPNLAEITSPMRQLLTKGVEFSWDYPQAQAFDKVKEVLTQSPGPVLAYFDPNQPVVLQVDASKFGLGATLLQNDRPVAYASKSLTPTEVGYAQIEKEMFAILFGCKRYHQYVYGRRITVQTDHKPLVSIMNKPLYAAPPRLQRMLLQLQRYDLEVVHLPGKDIPVADTLSRKYLPDTYPHLSDGMDVHVNMVMSSLPISDERLQEIQVATDRDEQLYTLKKTILEGWPDNRKQCPEKVLDFWTYREQLSVTNGLILKGQRIIIPRSLRSQMLDKVHHGHMGTEKCLRRAKDVMFWPNMSRDIRDVVQNCEICLERRNNNAKEPLIPREIPQYPWQVVASDLFSWNDHDYLVVVDYYSRYFEVKKLKSTKSQTVIKKLQEIFARNGIPEKFISDNGPQYASHEFAQFASDWCFMHETSSPHYPKSNGLAEKTVQTVKRILSKAKADKRDPLIALLEYRTTALSVGFSPSQLLMGRRLRSTLPTTVELLKPKIPDVSQVREAMKCSRAKEKKYYDVTAKPLKPLDLNDHVRIKDRNGLWRPATVTKQHDERSYTVVTPERVAYRRNRCHILATPMKAPKVEVSVSHDPIPQPEPPIPDMEDDSCPELPVKHDVGNVTNPNICTPVKTRSLNSFPTPKSTPSVVKPESTLQPNSQPYITRSGREVKQKTITSM